MEPFVRTELQADKGSNITALELKHWMKKIPNLSAGFTTRIGGASKPPYDCMNMALHVADEQEAVVHNRKQLSQAVGFPFESYTCAEQVHGKQVHIVTASEAGKGRLEREDAIQNADALVTNEEGLLLQSYYADCVPLLFVDPVRKVIGLAHAGWKGTVLGIAVETVQCMKERFDSDPKDILAAIGPSIGSCCYEVDERVINPVKELLAGMEIEDKGILKAASQGRAMLDLREINRQLLIKAGILTSHIECTTWCTSCHSDLFFSHRRDGGKTGRMASWIGWKKG
ncbi:peptidoglycan editing factor PgeF [Paenibacillus aquistagni]|uniref:peptidoglycan editing factor PgeF n=1 Tax=Paenibacillus aquistagni TaxID=1852522 RepID=UPI000B5012F5|nr:peptidoglycan editing factor PgeF [Paenibacillus aquistagni]